MQNFKNYGMYLIWAVRFLAGSRFTWLAVPASTALLPVLILCELVPSNHSIGYVFQSKAAPVKAIPHPKFRALVQQVG